jgi:hypothetical protein
LTSSPSATADDRLAAADQALTGAALKVSGQI